MEKRYQVFVSSTFTDLRAERSHVFQTLMEMDCFPAGMELFPAMDEEQFEFIKKVIDDCDYYLLIVGGRYGSLSADGLSYTEKEFDYACSKGMKIVAFLHEEPDSIAVKNTDRDPHLQEKLDAFRTRVSTGRLVRQWKTGEQLAGQVATSLTKTIKTHPSIGWIRGNSVASREALIELNELRKQVASLNIELSSLRGSKFPQIDDIASLDSKFTINGTSREMSNLGVTGVTNWSISRTWRQFFAMLSPFISHRSSDDAIFKNFSAVVALESNSSGNSSSLDLQDYKTISIQFKALGLVTIEPPKQGPSMAFWMLTMKGEQLMMQERVVREKK